MKTLPELARALESAWLDLVYAQTDDERRAASAARLAASDALMDATTEAESRARVDAMFVRSCVPAPRLVSTHDIHSRARGNPLCKSS